MQLTKQIQVKKNSPLHWECDRLCFASKNLYNMALWRIKAQYEQEKTYLNYYSLVKQLTSEQQVDYCSLPRKVSQQTLLLLERNWKSFFAALKEYKKSPEKFLSQPMPPNFKAKLTGRYVVVFTNQAVSKTNLKKGLLKIGEQLVPCDVPNINQVRIVPSDLGTYTIEVIYQVVEPDLVESNVCAGIDTGLNNLAVIGFNQVGLQPIIINGRPLKSINQFFNKEKARLQSKLGEQRKSSKKIKRLTHKRNNKIKDYLHKASRKVVDNLKQNNVSKVVIGKNPLWKQEINLRSKTNQNFVSIPHARFIDMLEYKCWLAGIKVSVQEESYTSKCSFFDNEPIRKHEKYKGYRSPRGILNTAKNEIGKRKKINSDYNGALNILKKHLGEGIFPNSVEGLIVSPRRIPVETNFYIFL
jgi:putative transposase